MNYNLIKQIFESFDVACINYCEIELPENSNYTLSDFITSTSFHFDILPSFVKENPGKGYLQNLVNPEYIQQSDFKLFDSIGLNDYLSKYFQSFIEWKKECDASKLLNRFFDLTSKNLSDVYLLDKKWFDEGSLKVNEPEFMIYDDFLQMIWFNKQRTKLFSCIIFND